MKYAIPLVLAFLIGCTSGVKTERLTGNDGKTLSRSAFTTAGTPREAVDKAVALMIRLKLQSGGNSGWLGSKEWTVKSDYYSASVDAKTAAGEEIDVTATWVEQGETKVEVISSLTEAQHKDLVRQIIEAQNVTR
jgi:hypothetical protein